MLSASQHALLPLQSEHSLCSPHDLSTGCIMLREKIALSISCALLSPERAMNFSFPKKSRLAGGSTENPTKSFTLEDLCFPHFLSRNPGSLGGIHSSPTASPFMAAGVQTILFILLLVRCLTISCEIKLEGKIGAAFQKKRYLKYSFK